MTNAITQTSCLQVRFGAFRNVDVDKLKLEDQQASAQLNEDHSQCVSFYKFNLYKPYRKIPFINKFYRRDFSA